MVSELEPCQLCGALPCDWVNDPHKTPTPDAGGLVDVGALIERLNRLAFEQAKQRGGMMYLGVADPELAEAAAALTTLQARVDALEGENARLRGLLASQERISDAVHSALWDADRAARTGAAT